MSWFWVSYVEVAPFFRYISSILLVLTIFFIILILLRPIIMYYFGFKQRVNLLKDQLRIQKKILEEMQFIRHSLRGRKIEKGTTPPIILSEESKETSFLESEEPIRIELKKDIQ